MSSTLRVLLSLLSLATLSCAKPESVALGGACKEQVECKAPADTCMTLGTEMLCTVACSAEAACPTGHACAKMDVRVEGDDGAGKGGEQGYCLATSRVASHVVTIAPEGEGKNAKKNRADR
jgi:hypothetical protein